MAVSTRFKPKLKKTGKIGTNQIKDSTKKHFNEDKNHNFMSFIEGIYTEIIGLKSKTHQSIQKKSRQK